MAIKLLDKVFSTTLALLAVSALIYILWLSKDSFAKISDFPQYYAAAKLTLAGQGSSCYLLAAMAQMQHDLFPALDKRFIPMYIPPPGMILFAPIGLFGLPTAIYLWKCLSVACLVVSVILLKHTFNLSHKNTCYLVAFLALSQACFEILRIDQIGSMLLLVLCAALYFFQKDEDIKAGFALSFMIVKPQLILPFLIYLIGLRRWKPLIVFCGVSVVLAVLSYLLIGAEGFSHYFYIVQAPESIAYMQPEIMPTVRGQLLRLCPWAGKIVSYMAAIIFALVIGSSWFCGDDNRNKKSAILWGFLVTIPLSLITSLHCHSYDLILLLPALVIIFTSALVPFSSIAKSIILFGSIIFMLPAAILIHYCYLLRGGNINIWFVELIIMEVIIIRQIMIHDNLLPANIVKAKEG